MSSWDPFKPVKLASEPDSSNVFKPIDLFGKYHGSEKSEKSDSWAYASHSKESSKESHPWASAPKESSIWGYTADKPNYYGGGSTGHSNTWAYAQSAYGGSSSSTSEKHPWANASASTPNSLYSSSPQQNSWAYSSGSSSSPHNSNPYASGDHLGFSRDAHYRHLEEQHNSSNGNGWGLFNDNWHFANMNEHLERGAHIGHLRAIEDKNHGRNFWSSSSGGSSSGGSSWAYATNPNPSSNWGWSAESKKKEDSWAYSVESGKQGSSLFSPFKK